MSNIYVIEHRCMCCMNSTCAHGYIEDARIPEQWDAEELARQLVQSGGAYRVRESHTGIITWAGREE